MAAQSVNCECPEETSPRPSGVHNGVKFSSFQCFFVFFPPLSFQMSRPNDNPHLFLWYLWLKGFYCPWWSRAERSWYNFPLSLLPVNHCWRWLTSNVAWGVIFNCSILPQGKAFDGLFKVKHCKHFFNYDTNTHDSTEHFVTKTILCNLILLAQRFSILCVYSLVLEGPTIVHTFIVCPSVGAKWDILLLKKYRVLWYYR